MHEGTRQVFVRYLAVNIYLRERERIFKFKWDLVGSQSKFARGNAAAGTANRVCQLFQFTSPCFSYRSEFAFSAEFPEMWPRTAEPTLGADASIFLSFGCAGEMQLRPRMHLFSLLARLANISSSTSSPLRFRILRQAEELKCSPKNVGNKKYCLFDYRLSLIQKRRCLRKKELKVKKTFIIYYFTFARRWVGKICELESYPKKVNFFIENIEGV